MHPSSSSPLSVPPGFRFHPTDEELLYYYLRKKVSYEPIDLDVIREIDLNKLEPWDLKDRCRIGTGPQDEWYFFSHKDKKYPTGTRTNRATAAGFWKATGRDKAIFLGNAAGTRIGLRKTLVFYTGRAPHGKKTEWIMHEYRLDDDNVQVPEDGWVVCRVFVKKSIVQRSFEQPGMAAGDEDDLQSTCLTPVDQKQGLRHQQLTTHGSFPAFFDPSMYLPQLASADTTSGSGGAPAFMSLTPAAVAMNNPLVDTGCSSQQYMAAKLTATTLAVAGGNSISNTGGEIALNLNGGGNNRFGAAADWSILDTLLASHQNLDQLFLHGKLGGTVIVEAPHQYQQQQQMLMGTGASSSLQRLPPLHYIGCETIDALNNFSNK